MNSSTPELSVVVLCYQSGKTIPSFVGPLIDSLNENEPNWEIILVGNYREGSGDNTPEVVKELAQQNERIQAVTLKKEGMMGWDMRSGLSRARGNFISVIDGDGQMPYEDIIRCYKKISNENLDLVKTYRDERDDGIYRLIISKIFNSLFKLLFPGLKSRDINSKPKIMRKSVYDAMDLQSNGWFIDAEIMIQARRMKIRVGEIPTVFKNLFSRPSFIKPIAILEFLGNLILHRIAEWKYLFKSGT